MTSFTRHITLCYTKIMRTSPSARTSKFLNRINNIYGIMAKIFLIALLIFVPGIVYGSVTDDFTVNRQSTYAVPRDVSNILVLDLTLPEPPDNGTLQLKSIKIYNTGSATHLDFSKLRIWEDGSSVGFDGDEVEAAKILAAPFFDTEILGTFRVYSKGDSWQRIFVTLDTSSAVYSLQEMSIKPELVLSSIVFYDPIFNGPTDASIIGFERIISKDASIPAVPVTPFAGTPEALSTSSIRWHFTDLSNNEFGFKILDSNLKEVARTETADISYLDETGLEPNTKYSGRRVVAFNDRGESLGSTLAVFSSARTFEVQPPEEVAPQPIEEVALQIEEATPEPTLFETIQIKIAEIQQKINELLNQLNELLQQQTAIIWTAFRGFLAPFFGK